MVNGLEKQNIIDPKDGMTKRPEYRTWGRYKVGLFSRLLPLVGLRAWWEGGLSTSWISTNTS